MSCGSNMLRLFLLLAIVHSSFERDAYHGSWRGSRADASADQDPQYWADEARAGIAARAARRGDVEGVARNVVLFLGDGMSMATLAAARTLMGQRAGRTGEETQLFFEGFPTVGLSKTYCVDAQIADSACSATAYLCGAKNNYGTIGVSARVPRYDCRAAVDTAHHVSSIAAWALEAGKDVGIVTTTRITHASPAGTYARTADRDWESDADVAEECGGDDGVQDDIAKQLVHTYPANQFKVILGGGRREFIPNYFKDEEGTYGRREDDRNLIEEWMLDKEQRNVSFKYVWNREELMSLSPIPDYLLGLFEDNHMQYHLQANETTEPTLAELTEIAIKSLSRNEKGFFLFVEGGRIDHAHHDNFPRLALDETIELSNAVSRAAELLPEEDSLLVVTADHAHVMAFNGYTHRGGDILGPSDDVGDDGVPYMTLSYANGPGFRPHVAHGVRDDITKYNYADPEFPYAAEVPLDSETHGGDDVAVFARGPHHEMFSGMYEQSQIPHLMAYAGCFGYGKTACNAV